MLYVLNNVIDDNDDFTVGQWYSPNHVDKGYNREFWMHRMFRQVSLLFGHSVMSDSLQPHGVQHASLPCPPPSPGICSNSCPLSQWCYSTISSSVIPFSSCLHSFPASGSFLMSQLFTSDGPSIGASVSAYIQGWLPLGLTDLISLLSKWFSRVFSNTTVQNQFFGAQPSLRSLFNLEKLTTGNSFFFFC